MHSVGSGCLVPPYWTCQVKVFWVGLGRVFWLWVGFFGLGWIPGKKSWAIPGPWVLVGQKLWPVPTSRIGRVGSDRFFADGSGHVSQVEWS